MRQQEIRPHTHEGPRTDQTEENEWIMTCETCGVQFIAGLEEMTKDEVVSLMRLLNS